MSDGAFREAKQLYLEQYASAIVTGGYLKIAVVLLSLVIVGLVWVNLKVVGTLQNFKPLVIRIDEIGRAQAIAYDDLTYKPQYKETRYFLTRFCQLYYRRNHATVNDDFTRSLYFLDRKLASSTIEQAERAIHNFLSDSTLPDTDVDVEQVIVEPLIKPPYRATVDFFKVEYSPFDHSVRKRTLYTASFLFVFQQRVSNAEILTNPLGLTITDFREDEAFRVIRNSLFLSAMALVLILFGLMKRLDFLAPSKRLLLDRSGGTITLFFAALGLNLFAAALAINRKLLLKDTGRKLSHFDNQLQAEGPEGLPPIPTERH